MVKNSMPSKKLKLVWLHSPIKKHNYPLQKKELENKYGRIPNLEKKISIVRKHV